MQERKIIATYRTGEKKSMEIKQRTVERKIDKSEHLLLSKQKKVNEQKIQKSIDMAHINTLKHTSLVRMRRTKTQERT